MADNEDRSLAAWAAAGAEDDAPASIPAAAPVATPDPAPAEETPPVEAVASEPEPVVEGAPPSSEESSAPKPSGQPQKKARGLEPWMKERLAEQTAKQREAERQADEARRRAEVLEVELATLRQKVTSGDPAPAPPAITDTRIPPDYVPASQVQREAERIASERAFNAQADAAYYDGKKSYSDFDDALQPLHAMGAIGRRDFQEAALATDAAPDVIYYLGNNPNEASKILSDLKAGNTAKAAAAMTKIAISERAKKAAKGSPRASNAPAPIRPVGGSALPAVDLEKLSDDDFTAEFNKKAQAMGWW